MVRYDDLLNGGAASPAYNDVTPSAPLPTTPSTGRTDGAAGASFADNPRTVLLVWFVLVAFLVVSHVITLPVQR